MKLPKTRRTHCPKCRTHTEHRVLEAKRKTHGSVHTLARASKLRAKRRGRLGMGNWGRYSRPPISQWKMTGQKQSKKIDLRFACTKCNYQTVQRHGIRLRKVEFV